MRSSLGALTSKRFKVILTIVENRPGVFSTVLPQQKRHYFKSAKNQILPICLVNNIVLILIDYFEKKLSRFELNNCTICKVKTDIYKMVNNNFM